MVHSDAIETKIWNYKNIYEARMLNNSFCAILTTWSTSGDPLSSLDY